MASVYNIVSIIAFTISGVSFAVAVIFWFKFGIWEIIGDLSGRTAKKSIEQMREENERKDRQLYRPTSPAVNGSGRELDLESEEATALLTIDDEETTLLTAEDEMVTTLLQNQTENLDMEFDADMQSVKEKIEMLQDIMLIHTNENIE